MKAWLRQQATGLRCRTLAEALPRGVAYPDTAQYAISNTYWSTRQSALEPSCFVLPASAAEVSEVLKTLTNLRTPCTVRAGGHTLFPGGSNIEDGVTIDFRLLNEISISKDRSTVSVGPGQHWVNASTVLDRHGLAVVSGRSPDVGVAGVLLGGGISFLSGRRGWACDNVQNYQVVLASGDIINANPKQHKDLYWALRGGGGSSFGIVTRFDLDAYELDEFWGEQNFWPGTQNRTVLDAFTKIARERLQIDQDAHVWFFLGYLGAGDTPAVTGTFSWHLDYTNPDETPEIFEELRKLPGQIINETVATTMAGHNRLQGAPYGERWRWWTTTIADGKGGDAFLGEILKLWQRFTDDLSAAAKVEGCEVGPGLIIQAITSPTREAMKKRGGNALGLEPGEAPLFILHTPTNWTNPSLDHIIEGRSQKLIRDIDNLAEKKGFGNGFKRTGTDCSR
ncbi:hypothetical protein CEP54_010228 [Fusarium duplospermum]|uniref:FAD-binding PCMH-type domain-containing protein n=1 Tax=Fusarium duplospermum TaxID=1325734 RepID=A0A428PL24_9HYPO|nr:hypothetical protein CEP54_010228 [Fusarium duplospermum]